MCATCGCADHEAVSITDPRTGARIELDGHGHHDHDHDHEHDHDHAHHPHPHPHPHGHGGRVIEIERRVLARNDELAARNRAWLDARGVVAVNLVGPPGGGKTSLLESSLPELVRARPVQVIEGDPETLRDAERIRRTGCPVLQINTGAGCHLDAAMVERALHELSPPAGSLVIIENVGNLVCPALFDLGEHARVVVMSVTEGDDKPAKYPHMIRGSHLAVLGKIDLLPHVRFDVELWERLVRQANPRIDIVRLSAARGDGLASWVQWLDGRRRDR